MGNKLTVTMSLDGPIYCIEGVVRVLNVVGWYDKTARGVIVFPPLGVDGGLDFIELEIVLTAFQGREVPFSHEDGYFVIEEPLTAIERLTLLTELLELYPVEYLSYDPADEAVTMLLEAVDN